MHPPTVFGIVALALLAGGFALSVVEPSAVSGDVSPSEAALTSGILASFTLLATVLVFRRKRWI